MWLARTKQTNRQTTDEQTLPWKKFWHRGMRSFVVEANYQSPRHSCSWMSETWGWKKRIWVFFKIFERGKKGLLWERRHAVLSTDALKLAGKSSTQHVYFWKEKRNNDEKRKENDEKEKGKGKGKGTLRVWKWSLRLSKRHWEIHRLAIIHFLRNESLTPNLWKRFVGRAGSNLDWHSEVNDLDVPFPVHHQIVWLDVHVHDIFAVDAHQALNRKDNFIYRRKEKNQTKPKTQTKNKKQKTKTTTTKANWTEQTRNKNVKGGNLQKLLNHDHQLSERETREGVEVLEDHDCTLFFIFIVDVQSFEVTL